ncbi:MAG: hypothetical protein ACKOA9_11420 [Actinomycetota bacterium]
MTTPDARTAPGGITFIVVLAYIGFILQVIGGIFAMIDADQRSAQLRSGMTETQLMTTGIVMVVVGVIGILLTGALSRGSNVVRILFGLWVALQVAGGLYAMVSHDGVRRGAGILPLVFGIVILYLLFNQRASDFFAKKD